MDPCGPLSTATAPCTGPRTSLFRQFAPELFLPSVGLPRLPVGEPSGPVVGPEETVRRGFCAFRSSDWTGRNAQLAEAAANLYLRDDKSRNNMDYREEAIKCVKDCVLPIHQQIYAKYNGDFDRIYAEGYNSKSYQGRVIEPGKVYELSYLECSCPKVKCGLRSNPEQCECSRQSILFILSQLEPDSRFDVRIENTILRGGEQCTFRIARHAGGISQSKNCGDKNRCRSGHRQL